MLGIALSRPRASADLRTLAASLRLDHEGHNKVALILSGEDNKPQVPVAGPSSSRKPDIKGKGVAGGIGRGGRPVPTEYKLSMTNRASKNLFVFGEKEEEVEDTGDEGHRKRRRESGLPPLGARLSAS